VASEPVSSASPHLFKDALGLGVTVVVGFDSASLRDWRQEEVVSGVLDGQQKLDESQLPSILVILPDELDEALDGVVTGMGLLTIKILCTSLHSLENLELGNFRDANLALKLKKKVKLINFFFLHQRWFFGDLGCLTRCATVLDSLGGDGVWRASGTRCFEHLKGFLVVMDCVVILDGSKGRGMDLGHEWILLGRRFHSEIEGERLVVKVEVELPGELRTESSDGSHGVHCSESWEVDSGPRHSKESSPGN